MLYSPAFNKSLNNLFINKNIFINIYIKKDIINILMIFLFLNIVLYFPSFFDDEENSKIANEFNSPIHIKPEWYFLFAYAILRSIPNKLSGVIAIVISIVIYFFFIFKKSKKIRKIGKLNNYIFIINFFLLTWIGINPVEIPFIIIGQYLVLFYFIFIFL